MIEMCRQPASDEQALSHPETYLVPFCAYVTHFCAMCQTDGEETGFENIDFPQTRHKELIGTELASLLISNSNCFQRTGPVIL